VEVQARCFDRLPPAPRLIRWLAGNIELSAALPTISKCGLSQRHPLFGTVALYGEPCLSSPDDCRARQFSDRPVMLRPRKLAVLAASLVCVTGISVGVPSTAAFVVSVMVTVPVWEAELVVALTRAVKLTDWPKVDGLRDEVSVGAVAALVTLNGRTTGVAVTKFALPACEAVIEQVPTETSVMTPPRRASVVDSRTCPFVWIDMVDPLCGSYLGDVPPHRPRL